MKPGEKILKAAQKYREMGYSVIPLGKDKKPVVKGWKKFQDNPADENQINKWWRKKPSANVGIVTGRVSNITVVDADSAAGRDAISEFLPDSLTVPMVKTPDGVAHYWFEYSDEIPTRNRGCMLPDVDTKNDGGYVVAPPSVTSYIKRDKKTGKERKHGGKYAWKPELRIIEVTPPVIPSMLSEMLRNGDTRYQNVEPPPQAAKRSHINDSIPYSDKTPYERTTSNYDNTKTTNDNIDNIFSDGRRDEDLFRLANHLVKSGLPEDNIRKYLYFCASRCTPPFSSKETEAKIKSALKRQENSSRNLTSEIREWVLTTSGNFSTTSVYEVTTLTTRRDKKKATVILGRLVEEGLIERVGGQNELFRRVESQCDPIDFLNVQCTESKLWLPFGLPELVKIMPGNIILIAGAPNAGKTAILLNIIRNNQGDHEIHYFNSEMGAGELRERLQLFDDILLNQWRFKPWERSENFADVIRSGEGKLNIIDFLEVHKDFYEVGGKIFDIHKKLKGAIAIIAIQKNFGLDLGRGGIGSIEKPRLALAVDSGRIKIVKAKNWKGTDNPNGKVCGFKIVSGCRLIKDRIGWHREEKKD